jgi:hypothetical protein
MVALSERKIEIVRTLVESAPDKVVGGLQMALSETSEESALGGVRRLVDAEVHERRLRNSVLQPLAPLCVGAGADRATLTFPSRVLRVLWQGLRAVDPVGVSSAEYAYDALEPGDNPPDVFDELVERAVAALRDRRPDEFRTVAEMCDAARPGGAELLIHCLEIAPVVRRATVRLPEWLARFSGEASAAARLAYKDAVAIWDDGGPSFFEMLAAQMAHPWMIMRVISEVMDKPTERYLADSELAFFGERVMAEVDEALKAIARLDLDGGPDVAREAGKLVETITLQVAEVETCVTLTRDTGWGARIAKQRHSLASVVEGRLRDAEKYTTEALPTQPAKIARIRRSIPRLSSAPDEKLVGRATTLLTFAEEVRSSANYGGFASARAKMLEKLGAYIDHYVEEVLDLLKTGDAENEEYAHAFLNVAADLNLLVQGEKAAELVRRRAVAAQQPEGPQAA